MEGYIRRQLKVYAKRRRYIARRTEEEWEVTIPTRSEIARLGCEGIKEYWKKNGGLGKRYLKAFKVADRPILPGIGDVILCVCGEFVAIGAKKAVGKNKPSDLQANFLDEIALAQGTAGVAHYTWGGV